MSIINVRKQLQKEFSSLTRQAERIGAALTALGARNGQAKASRKGFKMSLAARKKISIARRKQEAQKKS